LVAVQRVFYIVSSDEDEGWTVSVDNEPPFAFRDRQSAVDAAANAAEELWRRYGLSSGVKVLGQDGQWNESHSFG